MIEESLSESLSESESKRKGVRARERTYMHLTFIFVHGCSHANGYHPKGLVLDHHHLYIFKGGDGESYEKGIGPARYVGSFLGCLAERVCCELCI